MHKIVLESKGDVALVRLSDGVTNAIGLELLRDFTAVLADVKSRFKGLVLAGGDKFFSIGLNLPELLEFNRESMAKFWNLFEDTVLNLYTLPLPTACAITGHATGGGTILALTCDYRFMAEGRRLIALNEVKIGVPVPYLADSMLRQIVSDRVAVEMEFRSGFLGPDAAAAAGLVDGVYAEKEVESRALERILELAAMPAAAFLLTKQHRTREIPSQFQAIRQELNRSFMDCWFAPATQALLKEASAKF